MDTRIADRHADAYADLHWMRMRVKGDVSTFVANDLNKGKGKGKGFLKSAIKSEDLSSDFTFYPLLTGPVYSCAISTPRGAYRPAAVSAH